MGIDVWIGVLGGIAGLVSLGVTMWTLWHSRGRLEFRTISTARYSQPWSEYEVEHSSGPQPGSKGPAIAGRCRRAFMVVEFAITNRFPIEVTVGRIMVDGWMFSDRFTPPMYSPRRDYRVADMHTEQPINLQTFRRVPPGGTYALRLEVREEASGPSWEGSKRRYNLELPTAYEICFRSDVGSFTHKVKFGSEFIVSSSPQHGVIYPRWIVRWDDVFRVSDLLGPQEDSIGGGAPLPQGLRRPMPVHRVGQRLIWWLRRIRRKLIDLRSGQPQQLGQSVTPQPKTSEMPPLPNEPGEVAIREVREDE